MGAALSAEVPGDLALKLWRCRIKRFYFRDEDAVVWKSILCKKPFMESLNSKVACSLQPRSQRDAFRRLHSCPASLRTTRAFLVGQLLCWSAFKSSVSAQRKHMRTCLLCMKIHRALSNAFSLVLFWVLWCWQVPHKEPWDLLSSEGGGQLPSRSTPSGPGLPAGSWGYAGAAQKPGSPALHPGSTSQCCVTLGKLLNVSELAFHL